MERRKARRRGRGATELVFWITTETGKRIYFWWERGRERADCYGIWAGRDLRMLRRRLGSAESAEDLGARLGISTTMGARTWRFARATECGCFTSRAAGGLPTEPGSLEFAATKAAFQRRLWITTTTGISISI